MKRLASLRIRYLGGLKKPSNVTSFLANEWIHSNVLIIASGVSSCPEMFLFSVAIVFFGFPLSSLAIKVYIVASSGTDFLQR